MAEALTARDLAPTFPMRYELFCAELALGASAREAASIAGYTPSYAVDLVERPEIVARVKELVALREADQTSGIVSRLWAESQLVRIAIDAIFGIPDVRDENNNIVIKGLPINRELAKSTIMDLCKVKGWIVERKQVQTASVDLNKLSGQQLGGKLEEMLSALTPGARAKVKAIAAGKEPEAKP